MLTGEQFNQTTKFPEKSYFNKVLAILIVVILALFIFIIYAAYLLNKDSTLTNGNLNDKKRTIATYLPREPSIIYQRSGTITDIHSTFITVQSNVRTTSYDPAQAYQTLTLTLQIDANTVYTKRDFRNFNQDLVFPPVQSSNFNELKKGNIINFKSEVNIKNLTSFTASEIELIY